MASINAMSVCFTSLNNNTPFNHQERASLMRNPFLDRKSLTQYQTVLFVIFSSISPFKTRFSMAQGVSGVFFSWIGAVRCITYVSRYPSQNYRPTLAYTCLNRNLACYRFFACLFWWMGWGFSRAEKLMIIRSLGRDC